MEKIIRLNDHPLKIEREIAKFNEQDCTLMNKEIEFPTCIGYEIDCATCEVPKYNPEAKRAWTKLYVTGHL